jgi:hypothetical protein
MVLRREEVYITVRSRSGEGKRATERDREADGRRGVPNMFLPILTSLKWPEAVYFLLYEAVGPLEEVHVAVLAGRIVERDPDGDGTQ